MMFEGKKDGIRYCRQAELWIVLTLLRENAQEDVMFNMKGDLVLENLFIWGDDSHKEYCEGILTQSNLEESQILSQSLSELKNSLLRIEDTIANNQGKIPEVFLLERKKLILDRIQELSSKEKIGNLQELVDQLPEGEIKDKLLSELTVLREDAAKYNQEMKEIATTAAKIKLDQQRIDGFERKSKILLSFLQRESAASIIGGIVLLMLTVALIFGKESQILSNGFLVILGYFFGQSSSKNKDSI